MMIAEELKQIRQHFIYVDYYEYGLGWFFSSWLIYFIKDTRITPNQLTLASIFLNLCAAFSFARGGYGALLAGAILIQVAFVFDFADGQLARYKGLTSGFGKWMDIMGDVLSDCLVYAGLAFGFFSHTGNHHVGFLVLLTCSIMPFYCLHRQLRDHLDNGSDRASTPVTVCVKGSLKTIKLFPMNKKLIISLGAVLFFPKITLILVAIIVLVKFSGSVFIFILQYRSSTTTPPPV